MLAGRIRARRSGGFSDIEVGRRGVVAFVGGKRVAFFVSW